MIPDLSDAVDAKIGKSSGLDSIEGNVALWLDASNINYKQNAGINDGDAIAEWKDLSGNGHDLGVLNAANEPNYNAQRGAIEFDGVDDYLFATTSEAMTDFTMIAVTKIGALDFDAATHRGGGVVAAVVDGNHFDAIAYDEHPNSQRRFMNGSTNFNRTPEMISSVEETSLANKLIINQIENNNFKMVRDGVTVASHAYASALRQNIRYAVGQRFMSTTNEGTPDGFWLGDIIMEVMTISRSLSNEEQMAINHYLAKKWGMTATVDSDGDGATDAEELAEGTNPMDSDSAPPSAELLMWFPFNGSNESVVGDYKIVTYDDNAPDALTYDSEVSQDGTQSIFKYNPYYANANTPRAMTNRDAYKLDRPLDLTNVPNFTISFWAMANSDVDTNGDGIADAKSGGSNKYTRLFSMRNNSHGYTGSDNLIIGIVYTNWKTSGPYTQNWHMKAFNQVGKTGNTISPRPLA